MITRFDAALDIEPGDLEADRFGATSAAGSFEFTDASIHYLRPMPPVAGVDGTARFTGDALDITMSGGRIAETDARRGTALVSDIHSAVPRIAVTVEAEGPADRCPHPDGPSPARADEQARPRSGADWRQGPLPVRSRVPVAQGDRGRADRRECRRAGAGRRDRGACRRPGRDGGGSPPRRRQRKHGPARHGPGSKACRPRLRGRSILATTLRSHGDWTCRRR